MSEWAHPALRDLELEVRGGVEHFAPGQIAAWRDDQSPKHALLRWVDRGGHAWVMLMELEPAGWHCRLATRCGQATRTPWGPPPDGFRLTDRMRAVLSNAPALSELR